MSVFGSLQWGIYQLFLLAIFALCVWALVDAALRPVSAFVSAGKRTKAFWLGILAVATLLAFLAMPPLMVMQFLGLVAAAAAIVYLVDVRPAVARYTRRRPRGGSGSGW